MKILIALLFSTSAFARDWTVTHGGHSYKFTEEGRLHLKSEKVNLEIKKRDCSAHLARALVRSFESWQKPRVVNAKNVADMVKVEAEGASYFIPAGSESGKRLRTFPDAFVEASLSEKILCSRK